MGRQRISAIAHGDHPIAGPLGDERVARLINMLLLPYRARILDIGCGSGEWLIRLLERYDASGVGIDISPFVLERARDEATHRLAHSRISFLRADAASYGQEEEPFDLVLCAGSAHVYGGLAQTMDALAGLVRPGGQALVAHGFWEQTPGAATLEVFEEGELTDLAGTIDLMSGTAFTPLYACVSTPDEWDDYEWAWTGALERFAHQNRGDPDGPAMLEAAQSHRTQYLRGYRGTLGFVTCVLRRVGANRA
jgi:SAM-dependent methyltransferase